MLKMMAVMKMIHVCKELASQTDPPKKTKNKNRYPKFTHTCNLNPPHPLPSFPNSDKISVGLSCPVYPIQKDPTIKLFTRFKLSSLKTQRITHYD